MDIEYRVRRLTPTECARLQGFPDDWCDNAGEGDVEFFRKVFDTYSELMGVKKKTDKQISKWLKNPRTDAAEYKMWGNGVALPCVWFVLAGIVWENENEEEQEEFISKETTMDALREVMAGKNNANDSTDREEKK
nr:MAG TPA: DNA methyltransferase [Caudoviricetes sp.]